ncbi:hypothetical protein MCQ_00575 [Candidatus Bartonella washoeensis Sb944nv]|uniref:Uncharacterized protein n=1 Tax=Candidatus Bartonella washoeensis Sb944nv TaxID=1094563 RepID=J0YXC7_9HYPH|nr:hypothetical protein [Bartonella washoeensis]EJF79843.1 hypothetical protein MCQ_00575 [Bartonella washoeensis Sb944nv]
MNKDSYHSMKRGLALSLAAHVIFLSWGAVQLINPVSLPQQFEAIPITLAPLSREFSSKQGALNAPVAAISAVKPTTKPQEKEEALHFGEGQVDSLAPFKRDEKPRLVETTPLPSGEEKELQKSVPLPKAQELLETKAEKVPEVPQEVAEKAVPEEIPEALQQSFEKAVPEASEEMPQEVAEKAVPEEIPEALQQSLEKVVPEASREMRENEEVPLPQMTSKAQKMPVEQVPIRQKVPKVAHSDRAPLPQFKPKSDKKSTMQNVQIAKKQNQQMAEQTIEDILAMEEKNLLNRARTQGGGAKRSSEPEALGARKKINDTTKMAQTLVNIVGECIQKKLKLVALGGNFKNRPVVRLQFYLNREGMVVGDPIIESLSGEESQQTIMIRQVYAAVFSCQPYTDLPRDQYDLWGQGFDFTVDPLQEITQ